MAIHFRVLLVPLIVFLILIRSGLSQVVQRDGCNTRKICLNIPDEPSNFVSIEYLEFPENKNVFEFIISGKIDGYVALGFSRDGQMGDDGVFACVYNKDKNDVDVTISKNDGHDNNRLTNPDVINKVNKIVLDRTEGKNYCRFRTQTHLSFETVKFDMEKEQVYLLIAQGPASGLNLDKHSVQIATADPVNLLMLHRSDDELIGASLTPIQNESLVDRPIVMREKSKGESKIWMQLHSCFMIIAWIVLLPIGAMVSRFFKETWTDIHIFGRRFWFCLHVVCMISAFVFAFFGCMFIQIHRGDLFLPNPKSNSYAHCVIGIVAITLMIINISCFWCPFKSKIKKNIQFIFHFVFGIGSFYLGVVNIALTPTWLKKGSILPCYTPYAILIWWIFHLIIYLLISSLITINDHSNTKGWIDYEGWRAFSIPMVMVYSGEAPRSTLRKYILLLYIMVSLIIALILMFSVKDNYNC